jgi:hypothetical protein
MTIAWSVVTSVCALTAGIFFALGGTTPVFAAFGVVTAIGCWQQSRWQASTGHGSLTRPFVHDAAQALGAPPRLIGKLMLIWFAIFIVVVPAIALVRLLT